MKQIKQLVPRFAKKAIRKVAFYGRRRYCTVCQSHLRLFRPYGDPIRANALCPVCFSVERHRVVWKYFQGHTDLLDGTPKRMLHVAPEKFLAARFRGIRNLEYLSADLNSPDAMVHMDITAINHPDNAFSVIYCSHVLEHIQDDRTAMAAMDASSTQKTESLLTENLKGQYQLGRQLGRAGGMALVYEATELRLNRKVAIKVLPPKLTFGHGVDRFIREARVAAALDQPKTRPIRDRRPRASRRSFDGVVPLRTGTDSSG